MKIITTADGSNSLVHNTIGELYHSDRGAVGEAMHVFIEAGFRHMVKNKEFDSLTIFEIGFGSGLNSWLTLEEAELAKMKVDYHAIELYPVDLETAASLNFTNDHNFMSLHSSEWNVRSQISEYFSLTKYKCDLKDFDFANLNSQFDIVYHDAFSPDVQPEMWSDTVFWDLYNAMNPSGVVVTYTSKGIVKQAMRSAGFSIERLNGALGKRHMLRATKSSF